MKVGQHTWFWIGVAGEVSAVTENTVTLGGHTLPRRFNWDPTAREGVHTLSVVEDFCADREHIDAGDYECPLAHCDDSDCIDRRGLDQMRAAVLDMHDTQHAGLVYFCPEQVCRTAFPPGTRPSPYERLQGAAL